MNNGSSKNFWKFKIIIIIIYYFYFVIIKYAFVSMERNTVRIPPVWFRRRGCAPLGSTSALMAVIKVLCKYSEKKNGLPYIDGNSQKCFNWNPKKEEEV